MPDHHELPAPARPAGLDALLDHVAAGLPVNERRDGDDHADPDPRTPANGHCYPGLCQGCACCGDRCTHVLRIVSAWCVEANEAGGVDAGDLAWRLEQAGYSLPDEEQQ